MPKLNTKNNGLKRFLIRLPGQCCGNLLAIFSRKPDKKFTEKKKRKKEKKSVKFESLKEIESNDSSSFKLERSLSNDTFYDAIEIKSMYSPSEVTQEFFSDCETWSTAQSESQSEKISTLIIIDDEDFEEEVIDMSSQKSMITHILGQLRIGMDLEKIAMPAFILESRSILG